MAELYALSDPHQDERNMQQAIEKQQFDKVGENAGANPVFPIHRRRRNDDIYKFRKAAVRVSERLVSVYDSDGNRFDAKRRAIFWLSHRSIWKDRAFVECDTIHLTVPNHPAHALSETVVSLSRKADDQIGVSV